MREEFGKEIPVVTMFEYPTISQFAAYLSKALELPGQAALDGMEQTADRTEAIKTAKQSRQKQRNRRQKTRNTSTEEQ
jgi:hypothetical protein